MQIIPKHSNKVYGDDIKVISFYTTIRMLSHEINNWRYSMNFKISYTFNYRYQCKESSFNVYKRKDTSYQIV